MFLLNPEIHISTTRNSSNLRIGTRFNKRVPASWVPVDSLSYIHFQILTCVNYNHFQNFYFVQITEHF